MSEQDKRYERPTDDLRQVRHEEWGPDLLENGLPNHMRDWKKQRVYYTVQRKWRVQDGPIHLTHNEPVPYLRLSNQYAYLDEYGDMWVKLKDEWRDLPTVSAEEASK